ncbi:hypothetical protein [Billgrantia endophytica]|uniref:Uncharacterized protein n=1 Tax=Billgrantia endophytica TaxID=2033802 RepID=A0A2N7UBE0_9GAMM|nr:hypothetical protein [Halomonas endophytica]PMR77759.1 hypothetical protein C1H69_01370 [Halomonas endophytica]
MSHDKHSRFTSTGRLTALASAVALSLGTLALAGCGNDDDLPPVEQDPPATEQQGSPMQDATDDPGLDQDDTMGGDGAEEPIAPDEEPMPEAEQEPMMDQDADDQDPMMNDEEDEQGGM